MAVMQELNALLKTLPPIPIIVEGKKDKRALEDLGLTNIITLDKPLYRVVESIKSKEISILTDFDKKGKELYQKLKQECSREGIKVNNKLRSFLIRNTQLVHIEGLSAYLRRDNGRTD